MGAAECGTSEGDRRPEDATRRRRVGTFPLNGRESDRAPAFFVPDRVPENYIGRRCGISPASACGVCEDVAFRSGRLRLSSDDEWAGRREAAAVLAFRGVACGREEEESEEVDFFATFVRAGFTLRSDACDSGRT